MNRRNLQKYVRKLTNEGEAAGFGTNKQALRSPVPSPGAISGIPITRSGAVAAFLPRGAGNNRQTMRAAKQTEAQYDRAGNLRNQEEAAGGNARQAEEGDSGGRTRKLFGIGESTASVTKPISPAKLAKQEWRSYIRFADNAARKDLEIREFADERNLRQDIVNLKLQERLGLKSGQAEQRLLKELGPQGIKIAGKLDKLSLKEGERLNDIATRQSLGQFRKFGDDQARIVRRLQELTDPKAFEARENAGSAIINDLKLGSALSESENREWEQSVRAGQAARGNVLGNAAVTSEAMTKGRAGFDRYQQRLGNAVAFGNTMQQPAQIPTVFHAGQPVRGGGGIPQMGGTGMPGGGTGGGLPRGSLGGNYSNSAAHIPKPDFLGHQAAMNEYEQANANKPSPWMGAASGAMAGASMGMPLAASTYGIAPAVGALAGGLIGYFGSGG